MINWNWLHASYPFEHSVSEKRDTIIALSLLASLILLLLQPYGFVPTNRMLMSGGYLVISVTLFVTNFYGFPKVFPSWFEENGGRSKRLSYSSFIISLLLVYGSMYLVVWLSKMIWLISYQGMSFS